MSDPLQEARRLSEGKVPPTLFKSAAQEWEAQARLLLRALAQRVEDAEARNKKLDDALDAAKQMLAYWKREAQVARQALRQEEERR